MPSLVCAMHVCPSTEQVSQPSQQQHCADKVNDAATEQLDTVMLFVDCMGVDLQLSPLPFQIAEPTFSPDLTGDSSVEFWSEIRGANIQFHAIRGSPAEYAFALSNPPVYFVTQRFRL